MRVVRECQTSTPPAERARQVIETNQIAIVVNGEPRLAPSGLTVDSLLAYLGIEHDRVAVELDRRIVRQPDWKSHPVVDGSELEIVQFVGGG